MIIELEADGVHFYCSSLEVTRKLIARGARVVGQPSAEQGLHSAAQPRNGAEAPRAAEPDSPRG